MNISYDANVLIDLLVSNEMAAHLANALRRKSYKLYLCETVVYEYIAGKNPESVRKRIKLLSELINHLSKQHFGVYKGLGKILRAEYHGVKRNPTTPKYERNDVIAGLKERLSWGDKEITQMVKGIEERLAKDFFVDTDKGLAEALNEHDIEPPTNEDITEVLNCDLSAQNWLVELFIKENKLDPTRANFGVASNLYFKYGNVLALSASMPQNRSVGIRRGNWTDAAIAGNCAYADVFVTGDGRQRTLINQISPGPHKSISTGEHLKEIEPFLPRGIKRKLMRPEPVPAKN